MTNTITTEVKTAEPRSAALKNASARHQSRRGRRALIAFGVIAAVALAVGGFAAQQGSKPAASSASAPPLPQVTVSTPLQEMVASTTNFLGQFSAVDAVELRAQVGGTLMAIAFRDGQIVQKGDRLFTIDPRPYQIRLDQAVAQFHTAQARQALNDAELWRAQQLKRTDFGSAETVDQRAADQRGSEAAIDTAKAAIADAQLDLEYSQVTAPFTGRIGAHLVSVGSLVSGSRAGTGPSTLLATIVSLDPIYLDFDMSEADYLAWRRLNPTNGGEPHGEVAINLNGDGHYDRHGTLDFLDNSVNRASGTIHARATVPNPNLSITPGQFARLRLTTSQPAPSLLVPATAVMPDQSDNVVMTVAKDGTVVPKRVQVGDLHGGLQAIVGGLAPDDHVIINGLMLARPGAKVTPIEGKITPDPDGGNG